jgi:hypothetical protein
MGNGILRSEPRTAEPIESVDETVETDDNNGESYAPPPAVATEDAQDSAASAWKNWVQGTIDNERAVMIPFFEKMLRNRLTDLADELLDIIAPRVKKLELELAEARGALDVLRKGLPGGALNIRGTYSPGATYLHNDVVMLGGSSFVATRDSPGECPSSGHWQLLAACGKRGSRGFTGPAGERGIPGVNAMVPTPAYWRVDAKG